MKAVILVGGEGTRLRPLTCNISKTMVPVLNKPLLEHLILYLKNHGIRDIILSMGYLPTHIQSYFRDGAGLDVRLTYVVEETPLGTAGAVKNVASRLDGTFLVCNGDVVTGIDLTEMIARHREKSPKVSIALTPVENPTMYGVVETDAAGRVTGFVEKPPPEEVTSNMINAGFYIMEPPLLDDIPPATNSSFERFLFPLLLRRGEQMLGYTSNAYWIDIGTPEKYLRVQHDLLRKQPASARVDTTAGSSIHPASIIEGPVLIGKGCVIQSGARLLGPVVLGPACNIGEGATIEGSVLWQACSVEGKTLVRNSIMASHCHIEEYSQILDNCVLGDNVTVGKHSRLDNGRKVWPDIHIPEGTVPV
jgi:mannose-1-phosphate guanylyltransferase